MSDSRELQVQGTNATHSRSVQLAILFADIGLEPIDSHTLQEIASQEAAIVQESLPADAVVIDPEAPEEGLVVLSAAHNLLRRGSSEYIFTWYHDEVHKGRPYSDDSEGVPEYTYYPVDEEDAASSSRRSVVGGVKPGEPWGFSEDELMAETAKAEKLAELRAGYVAAHPLGEGAVLITNRYGGIDPYDRQTSERSILARFIGADALNLANERPSFGGSSYVEYGLLDERLEELFGETWYELGESIAPSIAILKQMREQGQDVTTLMPSIEALVQSHIRSFLEKQASRLVLASALLRNPTESDEVVDTLLSTDPGFKAVLREGAVDNHRKR